MPNMSSGNTGKCNTGSASKGSRSRSCRNDGLSASSSASFKKWFATPAFLSYLSVLAMSWAYRLFGFRAFRYIIPATLVTVPMFFSELLPVAPQVPRPFALRWRHLGLGLEAVAVFVLPYTVFMVWFSHGSVHLPGIWTVLYQLTAVAFPEELFFRGYLQGTLQASRNNGWFTIIVTSFLFALCHGIGGITAGDFTTSAVSGASLLLTFFPSLVMGWLYNRSSSLLPSILFHWAANLAYGAVW